MIISVWRPRYSTIKGKKIVKSLELVNTELFLKEKKSGWVVKYGCDKCGSINTTTSHVLFNKNTVYNTIDKQTCRSCRTRISEYEIKNTQIPYNVIYKSVVDEGYCMLLDEHTYNSSNNKSQCKINVICDNNHKYKTTWNNWSKGKRCRECYELDKYNNSVKSKDGWGLYKFLVWTFTENNYKKHKHEINPKKLNRGGDYHLDHKFSISEGFKHGILPNIIGGTNNLEIISSVDNMSKGSKCSITINELIK